MEANMARDGPVSGMPPSMSAIGKRAWIPWVSIGIALLFVSRPLARFLDWLLHSGDPVRLHEAIVFAAFLIIAAGAVLAILSTWRQKYDLTELHELQQKIELEEAEVPEVAPEADEVVCLSCGTAYSSRLPVCPNCKHMSGQ